MNLYQESHRHIRALPKPFWIVIAASLTNQLGNMAMVFLVLYLTNVVGLSITDASFALACSCTSQLFVGLISGSIIQRLGVERTMILSLIFNGLAVSLVPCHTNKTLLILICLMWGFTYGLYRPASSTFISFIGTSRTHKITFSLYRLVQNLGMSLGPAIGGYLAQQHFDLVFYMNGLANLFAATILIFGIGTKRKFLTDPPPDETKRMSGHWRTMLRDHALMIFVLGMVPVSMVYFQHESTLSVFLTNDLHFDTRFYGLLFTLNTLIIVFCELPLNIATLRWPYRMHFMLGSAFIAVAFALLTFASLQWHILTSALLWTIGEMMLYPSANSYIAEIAPDHLRPNYMAIYSTCSNIGFLFGPLIGAWILEYEGARTLWMVAGLWGLLSVLFFYFVKKPKTVSIDLALENKEAG